MRIGIRQSVLAVCFVTLLGLAGFSTGARTLWAATDAAQPTPAVGAAIHQFGLTADGTGWLLMDGGLYIAQGGTGWRAIGPAALGAHPVAAMFVDSQTAWTVGPGEDPAQFWIARTEDGGDMWQTRLATLPRDADRVSAPGAVYLDAIDARTAWLAVKEASSSNFSHGELFLTVDGGSTWVQRSLPLGEPVYFVDDKTGWVVGGPNGQALYGTEDGGVTWSSVLLPAPPGSDVTVRRIMLPSFSADKRTGVLPVLLTAGGRQLGGWLATSDGGRSWRWETVLPDAALGGVLSTDTLAAVDARAWLMNQTGQALPAAPLASVPLAPLLVNGVRMAGLSNAAPGAAWALAEGRSALFATADDGRTWRPLALPQSSRSVGAAAGQPVREARTAVSERVSIVQGAAFDICELPSDAELAAWREASPYRTVNLYFGGSMRACKNLQMTAQRLLNLALGGWTFIPTWVGPQAPCYGNARSLRSWDLFPYDVNAARARGVAEAEAATAAAQQLGLAKADGSGTVIFYDMEYFSDSDQACVAAAQAFVAGWTQRLHELGSLAGMYGVACSPRIEKYQAGADTPDAVWVAQWVRDSYAPDITVWNVACLSNALWANHQRILQYAGNVDATWGSVTLNIDSNVADGPVADLSRIRLGAGPAPEPECIDCTPCATGWAQAADEQGRTIYVAADRRREDTTALGGTIPHLTDPQQIAWRPTLPISGFYQIEAYVPVSMTIDWPCVAQTIVTPTASAQYSIFHASGSTVRAVDQAVLAGAWADLGIYYLRPDSSDRVVLTNVTDEEAHTRGVGAGAVRLTLQPVLLPPKSYLPLVDRDRN